MKAFVRQLSIYFTLILLLVTTSAHADIYHSKADHQVKVLSSALSAFEARLQLIEQAKHSIKLSYFIVGQDAASKLIIKKLLDKKRDNPDIEIKIIIDFVGTQLMGNEAKFLKERGIDVKFYNYTKTNLWKYNKRTHQKIFMIDNSEVIVGGRNIDGYYFGTAWGYQFLDRDAWVKGPIVKDVNNDFMQVWNSPNLGDMPVYSKKSSFNNYYEESQKRMANLFKYSAELTNFEIKIRSIAKPILDKIKTRTSTDLYYVADTPKKQYFYDFLKDYFSHNSKDNDRIYCESPYVGMNSSALDFIEALSAKNIHFELLTNSEITTDSKLSTKLLEKHAIELFFRDVQTYISIGKAPLADREKLFSEQDENNFIYAIHSKSCVIGNEYTMIASYNFTGRSTLWLLENGFFFKSFDINQDTKKSIKARLGTSQLLYEFLPDTNEMRINMPKNDIKNVSEKLDNIFKEFIAPYIQIFI